MPKVTLDELKEFRGGKANRNLKLFESKREKLHRYLEIRIEKGIRIFKRCGYDKDHAKDMMWLIFFDASLAWSSAFPDLFIFKQKLTKFRRAKLIKVRAEDAADLFEILYQLAEKQKELHLYNEGIVILKKNLKKRRK